MATTLSRLKAALTKIDRPGTFCVTGAAPAFLPGLEVEGLGPVGLPLNAVTAEALKVRCDLAPYGKGEETLLDPSVRRVWQLKPDRFSVANPAWASFLADALTKVQHDLGLDKQPLECHLHDLLLYEPGSFFLPHRDGEKLDRMVGTLVVALPSAHEGGELVVRHDGQERRVDFGAADPFHFHYAAFYADCEHEILPVRAGHRLCLVYNLTLTKGTQAVGAVRPSDHLAGIRQLLDEWAKAADGKLLITLDHQYTQDGLVADALKGADRIKAQVLFDAARDAGCRAYLALVTLHEAGSAEYVGRYERRSRRSRWDEDESENAADYEMGEIDSSLTVEHWSDPAGNRVPLGDMGVEEEEFLDYEALTKSKPRVEFEGYTGNAGMTLDHWYHRAAVVLWPEALHFQVMCDAGTHHALAALKVMAVQLDSAAGDAADRLRADCRTFAAAILAQWPASEHAHYGEVKPCEMLKVLHHLGDAELVQTYLRQAVAKDVNREPGTALVAHCKKHGWEPYQAALTALTAVFRPTNENTLGRNTRLLDQICQAKQGAKKGWPAICRTAGQACLDALLAADQALDPSRMYYHHRSLDRPALLERLARAFLASDQPELLGRLVDHTMGQPRHYPLTEAHVAALKQLRPWVAKHLGKPSPALERWVQDCTWQLEELTAQAPQPPADFRRPAALTCKCKPCAEMNKFLADPSQEVYRYKASQGERDHMENSLRNSKADVDCVTDKKGRPFTLVCTKNIASHLALVKAYERNLGDLAFLRSLAAELPT